MTEERKRTWQSVLGSLVAAVPRGVWLWARRLFVFASISGLLVFATAALALRYWLLPEIGQYQQDIAASLSQATGHRITIGRIAGDWADFRPRLTLEDVSVYDKGIQPALRFRHVEGILSWWSLLVADVRFYSIAIDEPMFEVRREPDGLIYVAGIPVNQAGGDGRFADWLLNQHRVVVRNGEIRWQDNLRQAPEIRLQRLNLRLEDHGSRHRFGLRAVPNQPWVSPVDIRGDLRGDSVNALDEWRGRLYVQLNHVDLLPLQQWVTLPVDVSRGSGGLRVWFGFDSLRPTEVAADVRLNDVNTRLAAELPVLQLSALNGRLGWKRVEDKGFEIQTQNLSLVAQNAIATGPTDLTLRYVPADGGDAAQGALQFNNLALEPLLKLADYLPIPPATRDLLAEVSPRGSFADFDMEWEGEWEAPESYSIKGRFADLGMKPYGKLPGLAGVSGNLDASQKGGSLSLTSRNARLDMPRVFRAPLALDSLTAQVGWKVKNKSVSVALSNVAFSNAHLNGTVYGNYQSVPGGPGSIDLNARLSLGDGRFVGRYIPLVVGEDARNWLDRAFLAGHSNDARLRLKGNLADFPFVDEKKGLFQVTAKVEGVTLDYAPNWPKIEGLSGDLLFQGARMEVTARKGVLSGVKIAHAKAVIPDLLSPEEYLEVEGETVGATDDALSFVNNSPVKAKVEGFTDGMQASGSGKLALRLHLPLRNIEASTVQGSYQFVNNRIVGEAIPTLDQVNGTLEFSESHVKAQNVAAQILGGPATINAASEEGGTVQISAAGRLMAGGLQQILPGSMGHSLNGTADWKATVRMQKKSADVVVESNLVGLGANLPYPFAKRAKDAVSLRLEKKMVGEGRDQLSFSYGNLVSAQILRRESSGKMQVERGVISVGKPASLPAAGGLWLNASLDALNLDLWKDLLAGGKEGASAMQLAGAVLSLNKAVLFDREFHDIRLNGRAQGKTWVANLQSQEITGEVRWDPQGRGKLSARLKNLIVPPAMPSLRDVPAKPTETARELPTLDVIADNVEIKRRKLGRLELLAAYDSGTSPSLQDDAWVVDRLRLGNSDYTLDAKGRWLNWMRSPQTQMNFKLDVSNLGRFLAMVGYPEMISRGEATLAGRLSWAGGPKDIDFPSLAGHLELDAHNGQFLKVDPGIGKLIGILSLQSIPRRLTLDFRDVFSEGFAFDTVAGNLDIDHGVMSSKDFRMDGPAAKVGISGQTDLANETQDLQVVVVPQLGDSVSVAGAFIGGPVVGITSLLVQKMLKDSLGQIIAYRYAIGGTWTSPKVSKLGVTGGTPGSEG
ncbi:MAG: YhdP family protein [Sulfuricellaceae bacterium]